ncbi:uncharacterized protein LOC130450835 [Diorhabda sublineata]|uniref:uncharacterized protein LOC130450835 n=1 Tax=Diorhabda sublineata TaxID=1163346 RepID=UPI0024E0F57C|nr:uncharacterized protein LOC130450835 [Diorhabda sublineata]XP_056645466.1 uncharacterized protein LOC130450835 [Diorhabda sublineata]
MSTNYSTALSHIVLAGTSIYCYICSKSIINARCSFAFILINSLLGVWRWGNPSYGSNTDNMYRITTLIQDLFALPFIVSTIWIQYGYTNEIALGNMIIPLVPLVIYFSNKNRISSDFADVITIVNCGALSFLSYTYENYFGMSASLSYIVNHFWIKKNTENYFDVPTQVLLNYATCFFAYFGLKAILN